MKLRILRSNAGIFVCSSCHYHARYDHCRQGSRALGQIVPKFVPPAIQKEANDQMKRLLDESYITAKRMLERNRKALDVLIDELMEHDTLTGDRVRHIIEQHGCKEDLDKRAREKAVFL